MPQITRDSLMTLEAYSKARPEFRRKVIEHKKRRTVRLGEHVTLLFEDELTIRYQVQEMLRIEKIFEESGIEHELESYNPLVPDGRNLKATMLIEYEDVDARRAALARLKGVESRVWLQVAQLPKVWPVADEDLERENEEKTSSVHFLRWELTDEMAAAVKQGQPLSVGVDHPEYSTQLSPVAQEIRDALSADLA
jgi:hypothetical protein